MRRGISFRRCRPRFSLAGNSDSTDQTASVTGGRDATPTAGGAPEGSTVGGAAYHERCARNGTAPRGTGGVMRMGNGGAPHAGVRAVGREPGARRASIAPPG